VLDKPHRLVYPFVTIAFDIHVPIYKVISFNEFDLVVDLDGWNMTPGIGVVISYPEIPSVRLSENVIVISVIL
jgi:hypothetical protein